MGNMGVGHCKPVDDVIRDVVDKSKYDKLRGIDFGYENLILEGGGAKGFAYAGLVLALEDLDLMKNIKRFAGTSYGSYAAALLALGATGKQLAEVALHPQNKKAYVTAGKFVCSLSEIVKHFGFDEDENVLGSKDAIEMVCGNRDITFYEVYKQRCVELCITGTNLSLGGLEYYHPKTTPNMKVADAVRIALTLPLIHHPVRFEVGHETHLVVDGGLTNNYPINAFDGWFLSMDPQKSFFRMANSDEPPFGTVNKKSLGALLFNFYQHDFKESEALVEFDTERPKTKKAKAQEKKIAASRARMIERAKLGRAADELLKGLSASNANKDAFISRNEFLDAMKHIPPETTEVLFGKDFKPNEAFDSIDTSKDGQINMEEFLTYLASKGHRHNLQYRDPHIHRDVENLTDFALVVFGSVFRSKKDDRMRPGDEDRTISIYTDYIDTKDFDQEDLDKEFLMKQAWKSTIRFLEKKAGHGQRK